MSLALGNAPGAPVPANLVLALVLPVCGPGASHLVVWDTASSNVFAEIGIANGGGVGVSTSPTKVQGAALVTVERVGSATNSLNDGEIMFIHASTHVQATFDCLKIVGTTGTMSGWLDVTVTGNGTTQQQWVVIPTGKFSSVKELGTVIEPD